MSNNIRILNLTVVRNLTAGQRQQLESEQLAVSKLGLSWDIVAIHSGVKKNEFEVTPPFIFRPIFLRNLYAWMYMLKVNGKYDYVLQRHMSFDPFIFFFSWFVPNRITVHHSKELEELLLIRKGWKGKLASFLERFAGRVNAKTVRAIIGVTQEIADYQCATYNVDKKTFFYPNGIDMEAIDLLDDKRIFNEINLAFVCGTFSSWHGLDLLVKEAEKYKSKCSLYDIKVHLIGKIKDNIFLDSLSNIEGVKFISHGYLDKTSYIDILGKCDIALGSLALFRENLSEASTLKVREYLAMGLPVIAAHTDSALPEDFKYFNNVKVESVFEKAVEIKKLNIKRNEVREKSRKYIQKEPWVKNLVSSLKTLDKS